MAATPNTSHTACGQAALTDAGGEHPAARRLREAYEAKYGDLSGVMPRIQRWHNALTDLRRPHNRDMERPVELEDVERAEAEMLTAIRDYAKTTPNTR